MDYTVSPSYYEKESHKGESIQFYEISNNSDLYFELELKKDKATQKIVLYPETIQIIIAPSSQKLLTHEVITTFNGSDKHL